jgi:hypothetical protein
MQDTKLNLAPYFDDFSQQNSYHKVLFKPGYSVQARELTTLQSILQNQIERFGQHIFKEGSLVIPGQIGYNLEYNAVLVQNLINGVSVEEFRENYNGLIIKGVDSEVEAQILTSIGVNESEKNIITFYVNYTASGKTENGTQLKKFKNNEILVDKNTNEVIAVTSFQNSSEYVGSVASITSGVVFAKGYFIEINPQTIILDQYNNFPTYKVGIAINESIVTAEEDEDLYDNAAGYSNYTAPGADRLKLEAKLIKQDITFSDSSNFIELLRIENGVATTIVTTSVYNELEKTLARRTYDESGDYTVSDFTFKFNETLDNGENGGVYVAGQFTPDGEQKILDVDPTSTEEDSINGKNYYTLNVSSGKAYVKGFEINKQLKSNINILKPRTYTSVSNSGVNLNFGSYIELDISSSADSFNSSNLSFGEVLLLKNSNNDTIGRAKFVTVTSPASKPRLYLTDITTYVTASIGTTSLSAGDFVFSASGAKAVVQSVTSGTSIVLYQISGVFRSGDVLTNSKDSNTLSISNVVDYKLEQVYKIVDEETGTNFVVFPYLYESNISGSVFAVSSNILTGTGTNFDNEIPNYQKIKIGDTVTTASTVTSSSITIPSSPSLTGTFYSVKKLVCKLRTNSTNYFTKLKKSSVRSISDSDYYRILQGYSTINNSNAVINVSTSYTPTTDVVVFNATGIDTAPTVVVSGNQLSITTSLTGTAYVFYKVKVNLANPISKDTKKFTFFEVSSNKGTGTGTSSIYGNRYVDKEISLGVSDVYKIHAIYQKTTSDTLTQIFDKVTVNSASEIVPGDIFVYENIKAKVLAISSNTLYIKYLTTEKLTNSSNYNPSLKISFITNSSLLDKTITSATSGAYVDITDDFNLIKNDTEDTYKISKLVRKDNAPIPTAKIVVVYDYFQHGSTGDYYSVASHDTEIEYENIPLAYDGTSYTDIIDFRFKHNTNVTGSGTIASPYKENQSSLNSYSVTTSTGAISYPGEVLTADYSYYLGRIDQLYLDENGNFIISEGSPSDNPKKPSSVNNGLLLATIYCPPYVKNIENIKIEIEKTQRYTMKDIGNLDKRLENVEEYTSLSLLELDTNTMNILDSEGRNRFKNGFLVDNFKSKQFSDTLNSDYNVSLDTEEGIVRPYPFVNNVKLIYDSTNSQSKLTGKSITLDYTSVEYSKNSYASRVENLNPFNVIVWTGEIQISPSQDVWYDTKKTPNPNTVTIDLSSAVKFLYDESSADGDQWGNWTSTGSTRVSGGTNVTQTRTGVNNSFSTLKQNIETETFNGISTIQYARSIIIDLAASKIKPKTNMYFFADGKDMNSYIFPKRLPITMSTGSTSFIVGEKVKITGDGVNFLYATVKSTSTYSDTTTSAAYSATSTVLVIDDISVNQTNISKISPPALQENSLKITGITSNATATSTLSKKQRLKSDNYGNIYAFIILPALTFENGDTVFTLTDSSTNSLIYGVSDTNAYTTYKSQGSQVSVTTNSVSFDVPQVTTTPITSSRVVYVPDPPPRHDPLAQSFKIEEEGGVFLTSADVYFQKKGTDFPVDFYIVTVENGTPTQTEIPNSRVTLQPSQISVSNDASVATKFTFKNPVYLAQNKEYAFILYTNSLEYKAWLSRLGENDIKTKKIIDKQPTLGSVFKSQNMSTWTPEQFEDIKYTLYRAKFVTNSTVTAYFKNDVLPLVKLTSNALSMTSSSNIITVLQPNHGMYSVNNKVLISSVTSDVPDTTLSSTSSFTNTQNTTASSTVTVSDASLFPTSGYIKVDNEIISYTRSGNTLTIPIGGRGQFSTNIVSHPASSVVKCYTVNGIPINELEKEHFVSGIVDMDRYTITTTTVASSTKKCGGSKMKASKNLQYEVITPKISAINLPNTTTSLEFSSITGNSVNNPYSAYTNIGFESVNNEKINELNISRTVLSEPNELEYFDSNKSLTVAVNISTSKDNVSPVINYEGASVVTAMNRINRIDDSEGVLDVSSELLPQGGKHDAVYICKKVVLENSSTAIKVFFDAIRLQNCDIKVFAKVKRDDDSGSFTSMSYIELDSISYPISATSTQYKSFEFEKNNIGDFKEFAIKIVLISHDRTTVPKVKNFRTIALAV